ncbi:hypothetical protein ACHAWF_004720 [Thalassiosira exigua]
MSVVKAHRGHEQYESVGQCQCDLSLAPFRGCGPKKLGLHFVSRVTDHCAIDLDQRAIESQLALQTPESFLTAQRIYLEGGHSKSYALVNLTTPLLADVSEGDIILDGRNLNDNEVVVKAYRDYPAGTTSMKLQYATTDMQADYVECQVGELPERDRNMRGCLDNEGKVKIGGAEYRYYYDPMVNNKNGRTIAGFSKGAREKMFEGCNGCPYSDFEDFFNYYGVHDYADQWVQAAFNGDHTNFHNGNADFAHYGLDGREQIIKKGTAYLNVFMYVIREFEDALDDCDKGCIGCNDGSVHAWDEGVCFYTGSIEGQDGLTDHGKLLHQLADKRCVDFRTCGTSGDALEGTSKLNYELFDLFALGNYQLTSGNCPGARETTRKIVAKMYVPMIQGALRYAYKVQMLQGGEREAAEGAAFAAAVLPRVHAVSPNAAKTIYHNLRVGAPSTNHRLVKEAFESVYPQMNITCSDIGGLYNEATKDYYHGMEPCAETLSTMSNVETRDNTALAIALGCTFGGLTVVALSLALYMRIREEQGDPVFKTSQHAEAT